MYNLSLESMKTPSKHDKKAFYLKNIAEGFHFLRVYG